MVSATCSLSISFHRLRNHKCVHTHYVICLDLILEMAMATEAAVAARPCLAAVTLAAMLLVAMPAAAAAVAPGAAGPAPLASVFVRPWVARLKSFHDLSASSSSGTIISLDGGAEQQGGGGLADCWGALMGLSSCYSEILLFFINGESYIGPECCVAIRGATRYCWPAMLASVGFTAEEADVLRDFCDGEAAAQLGRPPVPAPGERRAAGRE